MKTDSLKDFGNNILYDMCEQQPTHTNIDVVSSKIWLIGRAYSASAERIRDKKILENNRLEGVKNFTYEKIAPAILNSDIDVWIDSVKDIQRLDTQNFERILHVHHQFTALLNKITGLDKRSLASKYLHFHLPKSVFIYDSIANKKIREELKGNRFNYPKGYDDEYAKFIVRCLKYRDDVFESKIFQGISTPRDLDKHLLGY